MRKILSSALLFLVTFLLMYSCFAASDNSQLVLDAANKFKLPKHFRTTDVALPSNSGVSPVGLQDLHIAGSGEFSALQLQAALQQLHKPIIIVDLRQESHGLINGNAVSWYGYYNWANINKTDQQSAADEANKLAALKSQQAVIALKVSKKDRSNGVITGGKPVTLTTNNIQSEADLARQYQLGYQRFYVTDRHPPTYATVDQFIQFMKQVPPGTTLYFHCRAGEGRTTTFMAMTDMMRNAKQVSLNDIVLRQQLLGGINLLKDKSNKSNDTLKSQRVNFIKRFYDYCRTNNDNYKTSWTAWLQSHPYVTT
jgi:protein tyrosine phosphatase